MLLRYTTDESGQRKNTAKVYVKHEHGIDWDKIDQKAIDIIRRLNESGFDSYIVGGAVRDLLLGRNPKDFDIATEARPRQIKKLFWNSRIIGRRFKLVHIHFPDKIFEVSTFRAAENGEDSGEGSSNNVYGTVEEDARRRDFSINALYYCPLEEQLIDYVGAMKDFKSGVIRSVVPLDNTFLEDPVRMVRCIKYAAVTNFSISFSLKRAIKRHTAELARASSSRMTEEVFKLLQSGHAQQIVKNLLAMRLFIHILPVINDLMRSGKQHELTRAFFSSLGELDQLVQSQGGAEREQSLYYLIRPFILVSEEYESTLELFREVFKDIKRLITPITPPNIEVEKAAALIFDSEQIKVPKHAIRKPKVKTPRSHGKREEKGGRQPKRGGRKGMRKKPPHGS